MNNTELQALVDAGIIDTAKRLEISAFLAQQEDLAAKPRFSLTHVLWYAGALIIIVAMGLFTNEAFNNLGGIALAACGTAYAVVLTLLGHYLWHRKQLQVPGGLLVAAAVSMVPLIVFGIQDALHGWNGDPGNYSDYYQYVNGSWLYMEIATVIAAVLAVYRYPLSFYIVHRQYRLVVSVNGSGLVVHHISREL